MEVFGIVIQFGILVLIIAIPIVTVSKGYGFIQVNVISIPLICLLIVAGAFWPHFYSDFMLELMRFDFGGMNDVERVRNVSPELQGEATRLYWSNMGIGWPLKAIIGMVLLVPYPSLIWGAGFLVRRIVKPKRTMPESRHE